MKKLLFLLSVAVFFSSCKHNDFETATLSETAISNMEISITDTSRIEQLKLVALTGNFKIPLKDAKELAMYTATQMREAEGIVTKAPLAFKSVEVIKDGKRKDYVKTKGVEEKADFYLLNFENNQGYVLTSADRRVPGVFAYSSFGNLGDTISNPGQNIILERIMYYVEKKRQEFEENRLKLAIAAQEDLFKKLSKEKQQELIAKGLFDENGKRIITKYVDDDCFELPGGDESPMVHTEKQYGEWQTVYKKAPLVKTLWGQRNGGYNALITEGCDTIKSPVGCVAVAVGQIMAYHKKPADFKWQTMHWDVMTEVYGNRMFSRIYDRNSVGRYDIQYLLAKLGDSDLLDMNYGCEGSSTSNSKALETLKELGYTAEFSDYSSDKVISEIKNNRPVYISGASIRNWIKPPWWKFWASGHYKYDGAHAWVLDGYVKREREVTVIEYSDCIPSDEIVEPITYTYKDHVELVHNNFGGGGTPYGNIGYPYGSGWYFKGCFDSNNAPKASSSTYKSGTDGNYQYQNKIITNIK